MDTTRTRQKAKPAPALDQIVTDEEEEFEYDDVWPTRPANSTMRYQALADIQTESGRLADVRSQPKQRRTTSTHSRTEQPAPSRAERSTNSKTEQPAPSRAERSTNSRAERHTIPPRRTATQTSIPAIQMTPHPEMYRSEEKALSVGPIFHRSNLGFLKRVHWLVLVGIAMLIMILSWIALSAVGNWWQTTQDDWHYGRPRTFQTDAVVGHSDSKQNPSHFIAMNLNRHIIIIEIPGGDVSKSVAFNGPTLVGPGQDLTPATLTFQDVNHDGKLDMLLNIQGSQIVYLNQNGTFVSSTRT